MARILGILIVVLQLSCNYTTRCERHYLPNSFTGRVVLLFSQKNTKLKSDKEGCITYEIPADGRVYTPQDYEPSVEIPNETIRYFEKKNNGSLVELFQFREKIYLMDTISNRRQKYIFVMSAGITSEGTYLDYYVDYGENYKQHPFNY